MPLSRLRVVLVRPRGPVNIGMAARAVANFGLEGLTLVDPPAFDPEEARWHGPGAHEVVDRALVVGSVAEAVADATLVVATTARRRRFAWPVWGPRDLAHALAAEPGPTRLLFGPEDSGLSNVDLEPCHALLTLPTAGVASLNLAQAVTLCCGLLRVELSEAPSPPAPADLAPAGRVLALTSAAEALLDRAGYLRGRSPEQVRGTLFRLLSRARPSPAELAMLTGMAEHLRGALDRDADKGRTGGDQG